MSELTHNIKTDEARVCKNCGSTAVELGYELNLCRRCRESFLNRPIPLWIPLAIIFALIYALIRFPSSLQAGLELERGERSAHNKKYVTAVKHYKKVLSYYPDSQDVWGAIFIAEVYNDNSDGASEAYFHIKNKKFSKYVLNEINRAMKMMDDRYDYDEELRNILVEAQKDTGISNKTVYEKISDYSNKNPNNACAYFHMGGLLYDEGKYQDALVMYEKALNINPDFYPVRLDIAAAYRQMGAFDKAQAACQSVFQYNAEYLMGFACLVKIELKRENYRKALELAKQAYSIGSEDLHIVTTLALAYHFNNLTKERDEQIVYLQEHNYPYLERIKAIVSGEKKLFE